MPEEKDPRQQASPQPAPTAPAAAPAPAATPAPPAPAAAPKAPAAAAKPAAPSPTPTEMIGPELRSFLERMLKAGDQVTVHWKSEAFTGRIFRMMLHEGWIALEHIDGRRRSCWVIQGGKVTSASGEEHALPGAAGH